MSMATCDVCGALVDTDYYSEGYREEWGDACICDDCWQEEDEEDGDED